MVNIVVRHHNICLKLTIHLFVSGNFTDLPSNVIRLLEAVPALQGVTEVFRGKPTNGTDHNQTPDQFPLSPELIIIFAVSVALGFLFGFIISVLLPLLYSLMIKQLGAAYHRVCDRVRSFSLPSLPRITWGTGSGSDPAPPDLSSSPALASPGVSNSISGGGQMKLQEIVPPKSPPPDPPGAPQASTQKTETRTFRETQFNTGVPGPSIKKTEGSVTQTSKDPPTRLTKVSGSRDVVVQIENDKPRPVKDSVTSSTSSAKSSGMVL